MFFFLIYKRSPCSVFLECCGLSLSHAFAFYSLCRYLMVASGRASVFILRARTKRIIKVCLSSWFFPMSLKHLEFILLCYRSGITLWESYVLMKLEERYVTCHHMSVLVKKVIFLDDLFSMATYI